MNKATRARQRVLAVFLPVTAVLYISAEALDPKGTDQVITTTATAFKLLPIAAAHSSQLYLSGSLSVLALGGLAVSYAAIALLVTGRGWVIATVAALLGGVGAFAGAMVNVLVGVNLAAAASAHMSQGAAARFLVTSFHSVPAQAAADLYFVSQYAAPVVMGFALWRSRVVPRWLAVLFTAGLLLAEAMGSYGPIVVLFMLPFVAAMILLAARIWQAADRPPVPVTGTGHTPPVAAPPGPATTPLRTGSGS
jgi:hypothetical protein